jgi:membrane protease YdiL (CAAX protease family)
LRTAWHSALLAVLIGSAVFGWMHAYQQSRGAVRAGVLGAMLAVPAVLSGSVLPSMIAHAAMDIISGLFLRHRLAPDLA